jgi:hypothetical protein
MPSAESIPPSPGEALKAHLKARAAILYDFQDMQDSYANSDFWPERERDLQHPFHSGNGDIKHDFVLLERQDDEAVKNEVKELLRIVYGTVNLETEPKSL